MGLDTSHGAWHGAYSAFMRWREEIASKIGGPLRLMEGFWPSCALLGGRGLADAMEWVAPRDGGPLCHDHRGPVLHDFCTGVLKYLPLKWSAFAPDPLHILLNHPDDEGEIAAKDCGPIADRLEALLPLLPSGAEWWSRPDVTVQFIRGLRTAAAAGEPVVFH